MGKIADGILLRVYLIDFTMATWEAGAVSSYEVRYPD